MQLAALILASVYLGLGVCGFVPSLVRTSPDMLRFHDWTVRFGYGFLFGWLPTNTLHNILYVAIGSAGLVASLRARTAMHFHRGLFAACILFILTGLMPIGIATLFGLLPLFGWNHLVHTVTAVLAYYFGFIHPLEQATAAAEARDNAPSRWG